MSITPQINRSKLPLSGRIVMFFMRHIQQSMASLGELWRNPISSIMTMAVLGVSLSLPAAMQVLVKNAQEIVQSWDSAAEISLFVKQDQTDQAIQSLLARVKAFPEVNGVHYIDREQALTEFKNNSKLSVNISKYLSSDIPGCSGNINGYSSGSPK